MLEASLKEQARRVVGARQLLRAIAEGVILEAFIARDADPFVTRPIMDACEKARVHITEIESMERLGAACGIDVKASVAGLRK